MIRAHHTRGTLATLLGLIVATCVQASPLLTIRVTSLNDVLQDVETITANEPRPVTRQQVLDQLAKSLGADDLSFIDLTSPAALAMPQEGMALGGKGLVFALPVRDGANAIDVLARRYAERSFDGELTVLRDPSSESLDGAGQPALYVVLRRKILVLGENADLVRAFDVRAALSGEGLPAGSIAASFEIEPVAAILKAGLMAGRERLKTAKPGAAAQGSALRTHNPSSPGEPILVAGDIVPPVLIKKVQPDYPEDARRHSIEGKVILEAIINTEGDVENLRVLQGVPDLQGTSLAAVAQWKYKPALKDGRPVKVFFTVIVDYSLKRDDTHVGADPQAKAQAATPTPGDMRLLSPIYDFNLAFLQDAVDSLSQLQLSCEVSEGFVILHGRGVARPSSTLAAFIAAQRDVGMPAIGRMMPASAPVIIAGQVHWTDPSRVWMKQFLRRYQTSMSAYLEGVSRSGGKTPRTEGARLDFDALLECQRGDLAMAMDVGSDGLNFLSVTGLSDSERCRGAMAAMAAAGRSSAEDGSTIEKEVLEPEKITTYVLRPKAAEAETQMAGDATPAPQARIFRYAQIGTIGISGTDEWATKAIREAAAAREGSTPGRGGLVFADLGPFTQHPGVFGRIQVGTLMRAEQQAKEARQREAKARAERAKDSATDRGQPADGGLPTRESQALEEEQEEAAAKTEPSEELIEALEGAAGGIPFATRFVDGAATFEIAFPLAMLEEFAKHRPKPAEAPPEVDPDQVKP